MTRAFSSISALVAAACLALSCSSTQSHDSAQPETVEPAAPLQTEVQTDEPAAPLQTAVPIDTPTSPAVLEEPPHLPGNAKPAHLSKGESGTSRTSVTGCLASSGSPGAQQAELPVTRGGAGGESVRVRVLGRSLIVTHDLTHACCLKADVSTKSGGGAVRIVEKLSGTACRCMCNSTIKTTVDSGPGAHLVTVIVEANGSSRTAHEESVTVP